MYRKTLPRDRRGLAGAVATMFVLLIVLAFLNLYITGFVPATVRSQEHDHMSSVNSEFSQFRLLNYNVETNNWPLPETSTFVMGTNGYAPFAPPALGQLSFSTQSEVTNISYQLGIASYLPTPTVTQYYTASGIAGTVPFSAANSNSILGITFNGSNDRYNINVGSSSSNVTSLTLLITVNGAGNSFNITGYGNYLSIWYVSHGSANTLSAFSMFGSANEGYVQDYGAGDLAPSGWPHFKSITQQMSVEGVLSLFVHNEYYTPQQLIFSGGGIIQNQSSGAILLSGPQFSTSNTSIGTDLSLNLISLLGKPFSISGSGASTVTTSYYGNQTTLVGSYNGLNEISAVTLTFKTAFPSLWASYFLGKLGSLQNVTSNPLLAKTINGGTGISQHVNWGAYSISMGTGKLVLTIYNINNLNMIVGYNQLNS